MKPTYKEIMGWESFEVVRFDIGPLPQGQMRKAKLITHLLLVLDVCSLNGELEIFCCGQI